MTHRYQAHFAGKKAVVTGGSSGIGKELARELAQAGAEVTVLADGSDKLAATAREFADAGLTVASHVCDMADPAQIASFATNYLAAHGAPDILINNAGFATYRTFEQTPPDELARLMDVNFNAHVRLTRQFLPAMIARRSGTIVNMASIAGKLPMTPHGTYSAAKHALVAWSELLRAELARFDIQVNVICPGRVLTDFFNHETFRTRAHRPETDYTIPMPRIVAGTLRAIVKNRPIAYIPWTLGFIAWTKAAFPFVVNPIYGRLLRQRVEALYKGPAKSP